MPRPATGDGLGLLRQRFGPLPAADCRAGRSSSVWASSFLLTASNSICSPWITGPYNMHATALNALAEWGRVHEVRRAQPKLSGPLIQFGVSPFCRWDSRGALLARSFARFERFALDQPYRVLLSWAGYLTRLIAGRR